MILLVGATGTVGRHLLHDLAARGETVRALVRPGSTAPPIAASGVEVVPGDAADPASLRAAVRGVEQVFLAMGNGPDQYGRERNVVRAAAAGGVRHLVKVSAPVVGPDVPVAVARLHHAVEQEVRAAGLDHTFLRPYAFLQNLLGLAPAIRATGSFSGITGRTPMNLVDARDIAAVAAAALAGGRGRGPLVLTGAEAVSHPEIARRLTARGRPTAYVDLTPARYRAELTRAGLPPWLVDHLTEIQLLTLTHPERPTTTVADVTGRPPRTLDAFLDEHRARFATGPEPVAPHLDSPDGGHRRGDPEDQGDAPRGRVEAR